MAVQTRKAKKSSGRPSKFRKSAVAKPISQKTKAIISDDVDDYSNHPSVIKKIEKSKEVLKKLGKAK